MNRMLGVILLTSTAGFLAQAAGAEGESSTTDALIEQLGSTSSAERDRAARTLQDRGPVILPVLRKAADHRDAEVRRRVRQLIPFLQVAAAIEPRRVTLPAGKRTLRIALQEIEKQTGYKVKFEDTNEVRFGTELKAVTFWEAVERIRRETGHTIGVERFKESFYLKQSPARSRFISLSGSFRLEVTQIHEDRDLDFTEPGEGKEVGRHDHLLTLTVSVLAEPRFIVLATEKAKVEAALQDDGKTLGTPVLSRENESERRLIKRLLRPEEKDFSEVLLRRPSEKGKAISSLSGTILAHVVTERKPVVVTENLLASKGTRCRIGDHTLEITEAERTEGGDYSIHVAVPLDRNGIRIPWSQRIHVADAAGNRYVSNGGGHSQSGEHRTILLRYPESKDPKLGPATKLIIEDWVIVQYAILFEFKDLPLP